jgi:hypothetical protein
MKGIFLLALVLVCRCGISHASQGISMLFSKYLFVTFYYL